MQCTPYECAHWKWWQKQQQRKMWYLSKMRWVWGGVWGDKSTTGEISELFNAMCCRFTDRQRIFNNNEKASDDDEKRKMATRHTEKKFTLVESVVCLTKAKLQKKIVFCIVLLMSRRRSSASQNSIENATSLIFFHHSVKQEKLAYNQHQIMLHWEGIMSFHQRPLRKSAQTFPRIAEKWAAASSHHSTRQFILLSVYSTHQCADMNEWKLKMHR